MCPQLLYPSTTFRLYFSDKICQCHGFGERNQYVNMVLHTAHCIGDSVHPFDYSANILENTGQICFEHAYPCGFDVEDKMNINLYQ